MPTKNMQLPEQCCVNCHFLAIHDHKIVGPGITGVVEVFREVREEDRQALRKRFQTESGDWCGENGLCCKKGTVGKKLQTREAPEQLSIDRKDLCYFLPYRPGMDLDLAEDLERRFASQREAEKDRALTRQTADAARRSSWAAIIVALLSVVTSIVLEIRKEPRQSPTPTQPAIVQTVPSVAALQSATTAPAPSAATQPVPPHTP